MAKTHNFADDLRAALPAPRAEYWRYTKLHTLRDSGWQLAANDTAPVTADAIAELAAIDAAATIVFVDGHYRSDLSDPPMAGLSLLPAGEIEMPAHTDYGDGFGALNARWNGGGLSLRFDADCRDQLVHLKLVNSGNARASHPRIKISVSEGASGAVLESHVGPQGEPYFVNQVSHFEVAAGGYLGFYKLQAEGDQAIHLAATYAGLKADGRLDYFALQRGGSTARNAVRVDMLGAAAWCRLGGAYLARDRQQIDNTVLVDHVVADCASEQVFRGVLDDRAHGIFQGKIGVRRDAQRTDGAQLSRALLLSRQAEVSTKPELEIFADDVKCSHGATIGELDADQLYYLRARGIPLSVARALLVEAFMIDAIDGIGAAIVRDAFSGAVRDWLTTQTEVST
jgi:Fe-S cluster assembly protein SufD